LSVTAKYSSAMVRLAIFSGAGGVEVEVTEQSRGDVQRQTGGHHFCGEQPPEVVRREMDRLAGVAQPCGGRRRR
jgi:hypothetical protein